MQVKLNANFNIDNKQYLAGEQDIPANHLAIMEGLDIKGMVILTKEQTPLVTKLNAQPVKDK